MEKTMLLGVGLALAYIICERVITKIYNFGLGHHLILIAA